jgi:uncharacterized membrane protein YdbT with pleckstrin-like domain
MKINLKPTMLYCKVKVLQYLFLLGLLGGVSFYFPSVPYLRYGLGILALLIAARAFYRYMYLRSIAYEIEDGQIKYTHGILSRRTEYLELFRVRDLSKKRGIIDQVIGTMVLEIVSSDKSHPVFQMEGIPSTLSAEIVRKEVIIARSRNKIFEV